MSKETESLQRVPLLADLPAETLAALAGRLRRRMPPDTPVVYRLRVLTQRLRDQNGRMETLMTRDMAGRVADCLLRLARTQGTPQPDGICVDARLTQGDIAALVGATRERISRTLSAFRASGALAWDKDKSRWIILNLTALAKRAQM